jgi:transposase
MLDVSSFKHFRINHSKLSSDRKNHINGIEQLLEPGQEAHAAFQHAATQNNKPN